MDNEKLFKKYLHGEMSDVEYHDFVRLLDSDQELRQEFKIHEVMYNERAVKIKESIKAARNSQEEPTTSKQRVITRYIPWLRAIAAIFIISLISYQLYDKFANTQISSKDLLATHLANTHLPPPVSMGDNPLDSTPWQLAIEAYRQGEYNVVIDQIEAIQSPTDEQLLFLGLSHIYSKEKDDKSALTYFSNLLENRQSIVADQALWYHALLNLKLGNQARGRRDLQSIVDSKTWRHQDAANLLDELN